jgi:hypothetical protein
MTAKRLLRQFLNERGPRSYATAWRQSTPGLDLGYHPARQSKAQRARMPEPMKPFCLVQRKAEHRPESQRRQNGQRWGPGLAAPVCPRLHPPACGSARR